VTRVAHDTGAGSSRRGWSYYLPGLWSLRHYDKRWLRGDVLAGLAVAAYLVPQVMAYAEVAQLPAIRGLWAITASLLVYAVLGSSKELSVGPESTTALMTAAALGSLAAGQPGRWPLVAATLAVATGLVCLAARLVRLGFLSDLLSKPVLTGYMCGIGILMIISQLGKITGIDVPSGSVLEELIFTVRHLDQLHVPTVVISAIVVAVLLAIHRWWPKVPGTLVIMVVAASAVALIGQQRLGVAVVGSVPRGLPPPALPSLDGIPIGDLLLAATGIAVVGFSDNMLTARAFARHHGDKVDGSQELAALGAANIAAGLVQGFPVSSSGSRTAIAHATGARSQLSSLVAAALVVLVLLVLAPALATFPLAALGGVVVYAATRLVDISGLRGLAAFRRSELILALATTVAVLAVDVLRGIAIAIGLSILDLLWRIGRPHDGVLGFVPGLAGMHDVDDYPNAKEIPGLVIYRYDSPLFFANAGNFLQRALGAVEQAEQPVRWLLLNAEANIELDSTSVDALEDLRTTLAQRGIQLAVTRVKYEVAQTLIKVGFIERLGPNRVFATLPTAVAAYQQWSEDQPA
jgi:sulfate permease, SulP family